MLSCFLSIRSNDGDLNNQVAAILHLGNISFVEAGNEVVIAVLILGIVLCHHYSRQLCHHHHHHCHHRCSNIFNICSDIISIGRLHKRKKHSIGHRSSSHRWTWEQICTFLSFLFCHMIICQMLMLCHMMIPSNVKVAKPEDEAALDFPAHLLQVRHNYFSMKSYIINVHISLSK